MDKKENFKAFVKSHPSFVELVQNKTHTWQELFEVYDLYGEDEELWKKYLGQEKKSTASSTSITELAKVFKGINIDSVKKYIDTAQKAIGLVQEITGSSASANLVSKGPDSPRPINKIFED